MSTDRPMARGPAPPALDDEEEDEVETVSAATLTDADLAAVGTLRQRLWNEGGYRPIPVLSHTDPSPKDAGKAPLGKAWQKAAQKTPPEIVQFTRALPIAANTGIWCGGLRAFDFDIDDSALANDAEGLAIEQLGGAPTRRRNNSNRFAMVYRAAEGEPRKRAITGASHSEACGCKVEVLGHGQQLVAYGTHISGGMLYWSGPEPLDMPVNKLPAITEAQVTALLIALAQLIGAAPPSEPRKLRPRGNGEDLATEDDARAPRMDVEAALATDPNTGAPDWDHFNAVGMAVYVGSGGADWGRDAFIAWEEKNPSHGAKDSAEARWAHYPGSPPDPRKIGVGKLFSMAWKAKPGWRRPSETEKEWEDQPFGAPPPKSGNGTGRGNSPEPAPEVEPEGGLDDPEPELETDDPRPKPPPHPGPTDKPAAAKAKAEEAQRNRLIEVALSQGISYWHDVDGNAFASVPRNGHFERYRVRSGRFKLLLRHFYGRAFPNKVASRKLGHRVPGGVSDSAMNEALPTLEAYAQMGPAKQPSIRVWRDPGDATVWIDLGDDAWTLIAVTADGWRIVEKADVPLIRSTGMRALPVPQRDPQALTRLRALLNLDSAKAASEATKKACDDSFRLVVIHMLSVLWPRGPYCILVVNGEQGSAKTMLCFIIVLMTDPNRAPMRKVPRNPDDVLVTAQHRRLVALDNVSHLTPELADVLCGISTGTGEGKRQLYTDADEAILEACNPIIVNGIEGLLTRGDLADRSLSIMLTAIDDTARRAEDEIKAEAARVAPGMLALLLDGMVEAMRSLPTLRLEKMPRMADFTRLACAAAPAFGLTADEVFSAIEGNRQLTTAAVLGADAVAAALLDFLPKQIPDLEGYLWIGSATDLLKALVQVVPPGTVKSKGWPKTGHHLTGRLRRAHPALRRVGFEIVTWRVGKAGSRKIGFKKLEGVEVGESASEASAASAEPIFNRLEADASDQGASAAASASYRESTEADADVYFGDSASAAASAENATQHTDNADHNRSSDASDAADADLRLSYPSRGDDPDGDDPEEIL